MLFYVHFGNTNSAVSLRAKIPVGDVSWGLLQAPGQNWPFPPRAYEHRLGPNFVRYAVSQKTNHAAPSPAPTKLEARPTKSLDYEYEFETLKHIFQRNAIEFPN